MMMGDIMSAILALDRALIRHGGDKLVQINVTTKTRDIIKSVIDDNLVPYKAKVYGDAEIRIADVIITDKPFGYRHKHRWPNPPPPKLAMIAGRHRQKRR